MNLENFFPTVNQINNKNIHTKYGGVIFTNNKLNLSFHLNEF